MKKSMLITYSVIGGLTLVLASSLTIWAALGGNQNFTEQKVEELPLVQEASARGEYLVGEEFNPSGVYVNVGEKRISAADCSLAYDFSSAGHKVVTLTYEEGDTSYLSYYPVEVFSIRHLDIVDKTVIMRADGTFDPSRLIVWAELNAAPTEFEKPALYPKREDTVIILDPKQYSFEAQETTEKNFYSIVVKAGAVSSSFAFDADDTRPHVDSIDRILHLENGSGSEDKLTLYAQTSTNGFAGWGGNGETTNEVTGTYVLSRADGSSRNYGFKFSIKGWVSSFLSSSLGEGLVDQQGCQEDGDAYQVQVEGLVFFARGPAWHKAVLNMNG